MGFSSGASKAKRKAKQAAAAEYYKEFAKLSAVPELERIAATNKREVEDALGDEASFRTRNLSKKTDKLAREINKDDGYKQANKAYNDRYEILKDQIANKSTTRYVINKEPAALPEKKSSIAYNGVGMGTDFAKKSGAADYANLKNASPHSAFSKMNRKGEFEANTDNLYKTKEEAMADATRQMEAYNASINGLVGKDKPRQQGNGMLSTLAGSKYHQLEIDAMRVKDPSRFIKEEKFDGFGVLYRNLDKAEGAANDINALSKNIMDSNGMKNVNAYAALAEKLKPMIKRDARNAQGKSNTGQSLVSNELASATPYLETV